ncbi:acyl-CoA N-acyltransferase [Lipomyces tetrasporus]|uniref:histone acetyltransferase n=1 Tax=Lipomyces tetrasporus TaxID=54092 RepID=A0AAD7QS16_9ASCO|nr:acyl-CoA N-acyltransferase [Lipomyces tetrasporus]KAJ8099891.1 acyl-CoA N-acyltransferase [Lipomyces tetrasporus]
MGDSESSKNGSSSTNASVTDPRNVRTVVFGEELEFEAWYGCSSYFSDKERKQYAKTLLERLYVCSRCFKYTTKAPDMGQHLTACSSSFVTPGRLIYQCNQFSIREVDGEKDKLYCQCLSLFAKLFVDTKSIYFAVDRFKFYVLIHHVSSKKEQPVGFFSKEKLSWDENNVACILVFPPFQGQGLGQLLIEFSYQLSILEGKLGSPEKPLSEHGRKSYLLYWCTVIAKTLPHLEHDGRVSINEIAHATSIRQDDIIEALQSVNALQTWKATGVEGKPGMRISRERIAAWVAKRNINLQAPSLIDINCIIVP